MDYTVNQTVVIYNFTKVKILFKNKMNEKSCLFKKMSIFENIFSL